MIRSGDDIVPKILTIRRYDHPRTLGQTDEGHETRRAIDDLDALVRAYEEGLVRPQE